jgi:hypothetical protein
MYYLDKRKMNLRTYLFSSLNSDGVAKPRLVFWDVPHCGFVCGLANSIFWVEITITVIVWEAI